ncbi:E3 ubiquitin-protein ligase TRIM21 [Echinops telfairi]|uniref:E3 ubiquitin-protein ligase TRIM21 n=1 Tax=Echinops telfairi TaxID=9371 RepID=A0ABM0IVX2_ECHTE|nr:E3 ubiquitin-protein ligase TRIM21 [Echinops telfairi]
MASPTPMANLWEEVTCAICLDPMVEPVSIECGHSFCQECISQAGNSVGGACPICRNTFLLKNIRPNRQVANMVENLRQMAQNANRDANGNPCEVHGETLHLFCEEDGKVLCWVCAQSRKHHHHSVVPVGDAAQEYKERLQVALRTLRRKQQLAEKLEVDVTDKRAAWKKKVEAQKLRIHTEFVQQKNFLAEEEQRQMQKLEENERAHLRLLGEKEAQLAKQSQALQELISELEQRSRASPLELLQGIGSILGRSETWNMKEVDIDCPDLSSECCVPGLKKMLRTCGVHVTLDPNTANPWLILSEDLKQVRLGDTCQELPKNEERFDSYPMVLGTQSFDSGKLYWEVDVTGKKAWDLGVCRYSVQRKGPFLLSPENGFWTVWMCNKGQYAAGTSPKTSLHLQVPPCQVGIFLDCDTCTVSFYNVTDHGSLIYTFSECAFGGPLRPFFNAGFNDIGENAGPLTLCPLKLP